DELPMDGDAISFGPFRCLAAHLQARTGTLRGRGSASERSGHRAHVLKQRPAKFPWGRAEHLSEMTRQVALVSEACCDRDFRQGEVAARQHILGSFDTLLDDVVVWCVSGRSLEFPGEMKYRDARYRGQHCEIDVLAKMHFHVVAHATHCAGRQAAVSLPDGNKLPNRAKQIRARARVQRGICLVLPPTLGRRYERGAIFATAGDHKSSRDICAVLAPKQRVISFKYAPQADASQQLAIVEQKRDARGSVCADNALTAVDG